MQCNISLKEHIPGLMLMKGHLSLTDGAKKPKRLGKPALNIHRGFSTCLWWIISTIVVWVSHQIELVWVSGVENIKINLWVVSLSFITLIFIISQTGRFLSTSLSAALNRVLALSTTSHRFWQVSSFVWQGMVFIFHSVCNFFSFPLHFAQCVIRSL